MNVKELPTAVARNTFRAIQYGDLDLAAVLEAIDASYAFHWCAEHGEPGPACTERCQVSKLFRIPKA